MKHHGLEVRGQPQEWARTWTSCFSLPVVGLAWAGRGLCSPASPEITSILQICVQISSSRARFYLTIEVGELDTHSVYHIRLYRKSEFVFLLTTARTPPPPPYSQPHRYSRKQDCCTTLAEDAEKQTSFGVIWDFFKTVQC